MSFNSIKTEIEDRCCQYNIDSSDIKLVAVSKYQSVEKIKALINEGHRVFGENRLQEAIEKFKILKEEYKDIELHFIGNLQSNKVKDAVKIFDVIETIDRKKIAKYLKDEMIAQNRELPCFIQVNIGGEEQKSGVAIAELKDLFKFCKEELKMDIKGLMCIPPANEISDLHFALLADLAKDLGIKELSMGMSADFSAAIRYGSTNLRIGRALFS